MRTTRTTRTTLLALATAGLLVLTSCGGAEDGEETASSIPESKPFNQADVDFSTDMILHHAQALQMVDMAAPRQDLSPRLTALLEEIRDGQTQEAELMTDWLEDWDQPVPENPRSHSGMEGSMGHDLPGMMSDDDMGMLEDSDGDAFEERWLEMMIEHHEGAIEMAEAEAAEGEFPDTVDLAQQIVTTQTDEIDRMEQLLD